MNNLFSIPVIVQMVLWIQDPKWLDKTRQSINIKRDFTILIRENGRMAFICHIFNNNVQLRT